MTFVHKHSADFIGRISNLKSVWLPKLVIETGSLSQPYVAAVVAALVT